MPTGLIYPGKPLVCLGLVEMAEAMFLQSNLSANSYNLKWCCLFVEKRPFITGVNLKHVIRRSIDYRII